MINVFAKLGLWSGLGLGLGVGWYFPSTFTSLLNVYQYELINSLLSPFLPSPSRKAEPSIVSLKS